MKSGVVSPVNLVSSVHVSKNAKFVELSQVGNLIAGSVRSQKLILVEVEALAFLACLVYAKRDLA